MRPGDGERPEHERRLDNIRSIAGLVAFAADSVQNLYGFPDASGSEVPNTEAGIFCETLRLWASVLTNTNVQVAYSKSGASGADGPATWIEPDLLAYLEQIARTVLAPLDEAEMTSRGKHLRSLLRSIFRRSDLLEPAFEGQSSEDWLEFKHGVLLRLDELNERVLDRALDRVNVAADESEKGAKAVARAAGKTGDEVMSSFYAKLAKNEGKRADNFRWLTVFLALIAAGVALAFVLGHGSSVPWLEIASDDYVHLAQRAILVAGAFGLAGYFARQAHQHRSMANWAGSLAVQLQTFDAYVAAITDADVADDLRKSFGARVFGDHPAIKGEPTVTPSAAAMDTAVGWAAKLAAGSK